MVLKPLSPHTSASSEAELSTRPRLSPEIRHEHNASRQRSASVRFEGADSPAVRALRDAAPGQSKLRGAGRGLANTAVPDAAAPTERGKGDRRWSSNPEARTPRDLAPAPPPSDSAATRHAGPRSARRPSALRRVASSRRPAAPLRRTPAHPLRKRPESARRQLPETGLSLCDRAPRPSPDRHR